MPAARELVVEQHAGARAALPVDVAQARKVGEAGRRRAGCPAATISPCSRCTSRTTSTSCPGSTRSIHGSVYSPVSGSSRWQPERWQRPSRSATSPPSEPTGAAHERLHRVAGAQQRGGEVEHGIVRADRDDRALDRVEVAQQPHLDLARPRRGPRARRARRAARRRARARSGRRRRAAAAWRRARRRRGRAARGSSRRCRARRPAGARAGPGARGRSTGAAPSSAASSGSAKMSKVSAAETGIARRAEHRRPADAAEHDGMPGLDRDAVDEQRAGLARRRPAV